jgi:hypothetical protein
LSEGLDLVGLLIDGVPIGEHCLIVALEITGDGQKHALGLWDGATQTARICQDLLANLQRRGLRTDRSLVVILDGSKALRKRRLQEPLRLEVAARHPGRGALLHALRTAKLAGVARRRRCPRRTRQSHLPRHPRYRTGA